MHTRKWASTAETWIPCDSSEDGSFFILKQHPQGLPDLVSLSFIKNDLSTFETDLKKMAKFPWITQDHLSEWNHFFENIKKQKGKWNVLG